MRDVRLKFRSLQIGCTRSSTNGLDLTDGNVRDEIGASNAREPVRQPLLYDPDGVVGRRISKNAPLQKFERLYHSTATVIPDGRIWISGSNP